MSNPIIFEFESKEIRFVGTAERLEWVASDLIAVLYPESDKRNHSNYLKKVRPSWKDHKKIMTLGGEQEVATLLEPGFYQLLGRSNSDIAEPLQTWLYEEVIPSIRKTGSYSLAEKPMTQIQLLASIAQKMADQEQQLLQQESRIEAIEAEQERYNYPSGQKFTVMGFANLNGINISAKEAADKGRKSSAICRTRNIAVERIHDPRFGQVGIYPTEILVEVFKGNK